MMGVERHAKVPKITSFKKEVRGKCDFLHKINIKVFYKLTVSYLLVIARYVQSTVFYKLTVSFLLVIVTYVQSTQNS